MEKERFLCPLSKLIMRDPVFAADGHTYERDYIREHLSKHNTSPMTNLPLKHKKLTSNRLLKSEIEKHLTKHPELFAEESKNQVYIPNKYWSRLASAQQSNDLIKCKNLYQSDPRLKSYSKEQAIKEGLTLKNTRYRIYIYNTHDNPRTLTFFVRPTTTVESVKRKIANTKGTPVDQSRLIFSGRQLEDSRTMQDCNVAEHSTIHLLTRLRGD